VKPALPLCIVHCAFPPRPVPVGPRDNVSGMQSFDVAIVGLGAIGSAAAWHLADRGISVLGLDRHTPPHHYGSSHGHARIIREAYFEHPQYVPMVQRAYALWDTLAGASRAELMRRTGGLMIGPQDGQLVSGAMRSAQLHQLPCALWSAADVRERVPALSPSDDMVGLWEPRAGVLFPERCVETMLNAARARGARLIYETTVTGWQADGGGITLATGSHDYRAGRLILAGGPWMPELLPGLGLPLMIERAVQHWFRPPAGNGVSGPDRLPIFIMEYARDRLLYGLPDTGRGVKIAKHHQGERTTADTVRRHVDEDEQLEMHGLVRQWLPRVAGPLTESTVCLYTNTPDTHFILDRHPEHQRVIVASPCSGHGFKFASAIGEILADLAMERAPVFDLSPFRATRFVI
jgi:sarcosine oxidase